MKTNLTSGNKLHATILAGLLLGAVAPLSHAAPPAPPSPVGTTWDCVMSGSREGLAYMVFASDNTFSGFEILVPNAAPKTSTSGRNSGGSGGRTASGSTPTTPVQQIFGSQTNGGPWGFNSKGNVIGFFVENMETGPCTTNTLTSISSTNIGGITIITSSTNVVIDCPGITNAISFVGKVVPGKRLTLVCSTPFGNVVYQGVPSVSLPDMSGAWYGTKKTASQSFIEFFSLAPSASPNIYNVVGSGPGYTNSGFAVLSSQKKLAIVVGVDPSLEIVRAVVGPFNQRKGTGNLQGWDQAASVDPLTDRINFNVTKQ
jgi:hypothetical protein